VRGYLKQLAQREDAHKLLARVGDIDIEHVPGVLSPLKLCGSPPSAVVSSVKEKILRRHDRAGVLGSYPRRVLDLRRVLRLHQL